MNKNFELIGNIGHVFIGFILGYCILNLTDVNTINNHAWFLGFMFGGLSLIFIASAWELIQNKVFKMQGQIKDVIITAIGGALGGVLASFYKDIEVITTYGLWLSIVFTLGYVVVMVKSKGK
jgi:hypothetical protein